MRRMDQSVLIIEDDRESNENIACFLNSYFSRISNAYDGTEGWKRYLEEAPDLIITDIEMPKMDGLELVGRIRRHDSRTPIIVFSAYSHQHYLMKAIPLKLDAYLVKPITFTKLTEVIERLYQQIFARSGQTVVSSDPKGVYDWDTKSLRYGEQKIHLTHKEIQLIELFLEERGRIVTYDEIDEMLYRDKIPSKNTIKCLIRDIRKKMPAISLENLPKQGYRLI